MHCIGETMVKGSFDDVGNGPELDWVMDDVITFLLLVRGINAMPPGPLSASTAN